MSKMGHSSTSFHLLVHRVMNEVHGTSNILEHASVGHKQVAVLETFQEAERDFSVVKFDNSVGLQVMYMISNISIHYLLCKHMVA